MTTHDKNSEEHAQASQEHAHVADEIHRAEATEDRREDAAIKREDAAIARDGAAQKRDSAAVSRHKELRKDIEDTQHLVSDSGEDVIFRVEGLQDKFFEHLIFATNAIEDATQALEDEKRTRKIQIVALAAAVILGIALGIVVLFNTIRIEEQAEHSDVVACIAINEGRETIYNVLEGFFERTAGVNDEERVVLEELRQNDLVPLDCENGIDFRDEVLERQDFNP